MSKKKTTEENIEICKICQQEFSSDSLLWCDDYNGKCKYCYYEITNLGCGL